MEINQSSNELRKINRFNKHNNNDKEKSEKDKKHKKKGKKDKKNKKETSQNKIKHSNKNKSKEKSNNKYKIKNMALNDFEINRLIYPEALKYDKRNYFQYYWSLLRTGHIVLFSFITSNDYNSKSIKICLFYFSFALYFSVNALFFSDSTMHKIFLDKGKFNFIYQIPQIIYSSLISSVVSLVMKYLSLTQQDILSLKIIKNENLFKKKIHELKKKLLFKFILFFALSYCLLILFWIYISSFCAVYKNTQIFLIIDTIISFAFSLIYPFGYYLAPGLFRILALRSKKKNRQCIYKISLIIQLI